MAKDDLLPHLYDLLQRAISTPIIERIFAFVVDIFVAAALTVVPVVGIALAPIYFFVKDILPFNGHTSFGKAVYHIRVVNIQDNAPLSRTMMFKAVVRNIIILIPLLNLVDLYYLLATGKRLVDNWIETDVVLFDESLETKDIH